MAALAFPLLAMAAAALLVALGIDTAEEASRKKGKKRADEASGSRDIPIAKTDAPARTDTKCKRCPPDCGAMLPVNWHMPPNSIAYQARITGFPPGMEWKFEDTDFDGFQSPLCLLQEAKADYDKFFDKKGKFGYFFQEGVFLAMTKQAKKQSGIVLRNPPTSMTYYFQTSMAYEYMKDRLLLMGFTVLLVP
jgi:hypothetical protein